MIACPIAMSLYHKSILLSGMNKKRTWGCPLSIRAYSADFDEVIQVQRLEACPFLPKLWWELQRDPHWAEVNLRKTCHMT